MTSDQLTAIAAMQLTQDDLQSWMQSQGLEPVGGPPPGGEQPPGGGPPPEGGPPGDGQELSPEMATRRAEMENMSEEERAALRATREAEGSLPGGGRAAGGPGQSAIMLNPLIELLTARAAE